MSNEPLYDLGDTVVLAGSDAYVQSPDYDYYYSEYSFPSGMVSIREQYYYSGDNGEFYEYSSQDGAIVDSISISSYAEQYDSAGRLASSAYTISSEYYYGPRDYGSYATSEEEKYFYADTSGFELDYSVSTLTSEYFTDEGPGSFTSITQSDYSYTSTPVSVYDYYQRRDVTSVENDGDGVIDITVYSLNTNTSLGSSSSHASASYNSLGVQTESSIGESTQTYLNNSYTFEGEGSYVSDYDGDGIINYSNEYSYIDLTNSDGSLASTESSSIYRVDYDKDGMADCINIGMEKMTQSGGKAVDLTWESNGAGNEGVLTIEVSKELDGDFTYDQTRSFSFDFRAPAAFAGMGGHVATIEDTYLTAPDSLV